MGKPTWDHATIARFRSKHVCPAQEKLLAQMTDWLEKKSGAVSFQGYLHPAGAKIGLLPTNYNGFVRKKSREEESCQAAELAAGFSATI